MSEDELKKRPLLELLLIAMGIGGIGLTVLISALFVGAGLFMPGAGVVAGVGLGIIGFTAGIGLISLSYILRYLRIIAAGSGIGRTFE